MTICRFAAGCTNLRRMPGFAEAALKRYVIKGDLKCELPGRWRFV